MATPAPAISWGAFLIPGLDEVGAWFLFVLGSLAIFVTAIMMKGYRLHPTA